MIHNDKKYSSASDQENFTLKEIAKYSLYTLVASLLNQELEPRGAGNTEILETLML